MSKKSVDQACHGDPHEVPADHGVLRLGSQAPEPRTLVDIFTTTVDKFPEAPAIDDGTCVYTYQQFQDAANDVAERLRLVAVAPGDKVGVRISSGTVDLYVAIMGILLAGAAYVPVDFDDPDERAKMVFGEAQVAAIVGEGLAVEAQKPVSDPEQAIAAQRPGLADDAWVIFTSGSTGKPKGVAVTHRNAAAFVDAEAQLFLQKAPLGPQDRVMAGLSVAFDASCEEMWLAWRYGACLVPAPRSLVRSGVDLGPWLTARGITVVSTVPTLVMLWPADALEQVRLLILGGEACPPEIGVRFATDTREVWNTYGPTEATVVACAAQLTGEPPVRIGLPLAGWDLEVVDSDDNPVAEGESGELIIGGVGLARYLDPVKDAEKYAPMPALGWQRAYRSGDLVVKDSAGLLFQGRADDQVKVGGRRIELGEIDAALLELPGVAGAAAAVRKLPSGSSVLVGYVAVEPGFDKQDSAAILREQMPAALVPRLAVVEELPTRTSGKIDRNALPWPLPGDDSADTGDFSDRELPMRQAFSDVLGATVPSRHDDFFDLGGSSLTAALLVAALRTEHPQLTVGLLYEHPTVAGLTKALHKGKADSPRRRTNSEVKPVPLTSRVVQGFLNVLLRSVGGLRWVTLIAAGCWIVQLFTDWKWLPLSIWPVVLAGLVFFFVTPFKMLAAAAFARLVLLGLRPGTYRRAGSHHLRVWAAERFADEIGAVSLSGATLMSWYASLLGVKVGRDVDLHAVPPITGMLTLGDECAVEPEVDLAGHWVDGDSFHVGPVFIGRGARVGARSTLAPGSRVGAQAEVAAGSAVFGKVPKKEFWAGAPAQRHSRARGPWKGEHPPHMASWRAIYAISGSLIALFPVLAYALASVPWLPWIAGAASPVSAAQRLLIAAPAAALSGFLVLMLLVWASVRVTSWKMNPGVFPVHSAGGWRGWFIIRLLDDARTWLFPLYSSTWTPWWLRSLGAKIGKDVEASTTLMIPKFVTVGQGAFLADDTLIGGYELGGGWMRVERVKIGRGAFVGNSGMAAPGRKVPKRGLVAVLSAAPNRAKAKAGTSWIGSPPAKLRRESESVDTRRTHEPTRWLKFCRAAFELCRVIPIALSGVLATAAVVALLWLAHVGGWTLAVLLSGVVLIAVGWLSVLCAVLAKWLLIGRFKRSDSPLWSSLVWRSELADSFVELLAAQWFASWAAGTAAMNIWWRLMGASMGRGAWCESYWLPEADLVRLGRGATVNRGCVVQTHLFHDRVLSMDTVSLAEGATLGPNSVVLPAATVDRHATVGPASLVMRGEKVPEFSRWAGNPIGPWSKRLDKGAGVKS